MFGLTEPGHENRSAGFCLMTSGELRGDLKQVLESVLTTCDDLIHACEQAAVNW